MAVGEEISFLVVLMSFYLLFIGSDDVALLLICHHDTNVFCNLLLGLCGFRSIKSFRRSLSEEIGGKRENRSNYHQLHSAISSDKTRTKVTKECPIRLRHHRGPIL